MDCSFCGTGIPRGTEYLYVTAKGRVYYFCSSKCLKNKVKLGRKARRVKWTKTYAAEKEGRIGASAQKPEQKPAEKKPVKEDAGAKKKPKTKPESVGKQEKTEPKRKRKAAKKQQEDSEGEE